MVDGELVGFGQERFDCLPGAGAVLLAGGVAVDVGVLYDEVAAWCDDGP